MATINDVAKLCGVSSMTVSRVMSGKQNVSENTREKVQRAVEQLGYHTNHLARGLVTKKSGTIGVLLTNMSNSVYSAMIYGIGDRARERGYDILISNCNTPEHAIQGIGTMLSKQVDGIVLLPIEFSAFDEHRYNLRTVAMNLDRSVSFYSWLDQHILSQEEMRRKIVFTGNMTGNVEFKNVNVVESDVRGGACIAVEYLISKGHRKIGYLACKSDEGVWHKRTEGIFETLRYNNVSFDIDCMESCDDDAADAKRAAGLLLERHPELTALICGNDIMAIGAEFAAMERGLKVPDDISIIGNDGIDFGQMVSPALTSISIESYEVGRTCIDVLLNSIDGGEISRRRVNARLLERDSVRALTE